ncbi:hypothetical protein GI482_02470 [Bacillus sp. N3536]|nr:hypothetical protein GI482_02470 [Bacillus sp. N3536]
MNKGTRQNPVHAVQKTHVVVEKELNQTKESHLNSFLNEVGKKFYSRGIIIIIDKWGKNAEDALTGRDKEITLISLG